MIREADIDGGKLIDTLVGINADSLLPFRRSSQLRRVRDHDDFEINVTKDVSLIITYYRRKQISLFISFCLSLSLDCLSLLLCACTPCSFVHFILLFVLVLLFRQIISYSTHTRTPDFWFVFLLFTNTSRHARPPVNTHTHILASGVLDQKHQPLLFRRCQQFLFFPTYIVQTFFAWMFFSRI